jgi:hypothetical protein
MTEAKSYERPIKVLVAGQEMLLEPIRGLRRLQAFEDAVTEEVWAFKERLETGGVKANSPEHLLTKAVDVPRLLKLACPIFEDSELLEETTALERLGLLEDALALNGLGHMSVFLSPATLIEIGMRLSKMSHEILEKEFGSPESSETSSEPVLTGTASTLTSTSGKPARSVKSGLKTSG